MKRALELAQWGQGSVSPNPMVGCVIVHQDKIIGEGWHQLYGQAHAEVNAIHQVSDPSLLPESTVYVNLEPCAHFGKTPPCADLLVSKKVKKVVIANVDSNPLVGGKGIEKLLQAGIEVETGILEAEGRWLNRRFFKLIEQQRPYVILKWAQTADGFIARKNFDSKWISNAHSRKLVHQWRAEEDAILVGANTALHDNPQLNVREWTGRNPVRLVIDRNLRLPETLHLFDQSQRTLVFNLHQNQEEGQMEWIKLGADDFFAQLLHELGKRKIQSVIIEGGSVILQEFIRQQLWDEARIFTSSQTFESGISAPAISGNIIYEQFVTDDKLQILTRQN